MAEKPPAFQFYAADYLADADVQLLTSSQEGVYIRLLSYCWREGSIPEVPEVAQMLCKRDSLLNDVEHVLKTFFVSGKESGRLVNPRLEKERKKQDAFRKQKSEAGRKSGQSRRKSAEHTLNDRSDSVRTESEQNDDSVRTKSNSSSSSSSSSSIEEKVEKEMEFSLSQERTKGDDLTFPTAPPENVRRFIEAYPKKTKKNLVPEAFYQATIRVMAERSMSALVAEEWLITKAVGYAASPAGQNPDRDKIPNPAAWLDEGRYDDGPGEWDLKKPPGRFEPPKPKIQPLKKKDTQIGDQLMDLMK